ncbi:MAG: hypothetical protein IKS17_02395 [Firmicutes bacterium]|nr:hypothetical protein [Bacillota bacterium]
MFAVLFAVMAVMLIQTAVYADVPVFTRQPTDVVLSSTTEGSVYYKLNRNDVRVELWEVGGTSCINALGSSTACPVSEAIGKTCYLRAYVTGSSQYAQSNNFKVSINRAFIQQPQDLTVTQPTGNKVYYQLNFTPSFVVLYCIVGEDIVGIPNAADATSCNVDGVLGQTCFLRANYNTSSGSYYIQVRMRIILLY